MAAKKKAKKIVKKTAKPAPKAKKAAKPKPPPAPPAPPSGKFVWHEYSTSDIPAAVSFYTSLFGWTTEEMDMGPGGKYTIFKSGAVQVGGVMTVPGVPPHWGQYCTVPDVDKAAEKATELGGTVLHPPTDIPTIGRFAMVKDPQGAVLAPFKPSMPGTPPAGPPPAGTFCWDELLTTDPEAALAFYKAIYGWTTTDMEMPTGKYYVLHSGDSMSGGAMKLPMPEIPPHWQSHVAVADLDA
jgi:predicted enzyme related to lactoylglutathione lyase